MDETTSTTPSELPAVSANASSLFWLVASVVVTTAVSLAAAHAPPRVRLIGLFSIAFGLVVGWLLVRLAEKLEARPSRCLMGVVAAVLSFTGLVGSTWETARLEASRQPKSDKDRLAARLMEQMKAQSKEQDPQRCPALTEFRRYLSWRLRQLGEWKSPWPEVFWFGELVAASVASVWIAIRCQATPGRVLNQRMSEVP